MIKRNEKQIFLLDKVHFDKFVVDLGLMLGRNLLNLVGSDVAYIYRKCMLAMTQRFDDNLHFIQLSQIKSPFEITAILKAQTTIVGGVTPAPVITSSPRSNEH